MSYIKKNKKLFLMFFIIICLVTLIWMKYLHTPEVYDWQVKNDHTEFVAHGYLVPIIDQLNGINADPIYLSVNYQTALIDLGVNKGIPKRELLEALSVVEQQNSSIGIPVFLETAKYNNTNVVAVTTKIVYDDLLTRIFKPNSAYCSYCVIAIDTAAHEILFQDR